MSDRKKNYDDEGRGGPGGVGLIIRTIRTTTTRMMMMWQIIDFRDKEQYL